MQVGEEYRSNALQQFAFEVRSPKQCREVQPLGSQKDARTLGTLPRPLSSRLCRSLGFWSSLVSSLPTILRRARSPLRRDPRRCSFPLVCASRRARSSTCPNEQVDDRTIGLDGKRGRGWTQARIGEALGVAQSTITEDLRGLSTVDKPSRPKGGRQSTTALRVPVSLRGGAT